ncbi:MAG: hypothetical protein Q9N34_06695 [Aquificota bacterium]|nr:hypothetical protein [Aquificota bacterium]
MKAPDARDFKTLKKLLRELKRYALILILRTRPYHVVRIIG